MTTRLLLAAVAAMFMLAIAAGTAGAACPAAPAGYKGYGKANFPAGADRTISGDGLTLLVRKNSMATWISDTPVIDSWICMSLWLPDAPPNSQIGGGIVFWKRDAQHFYVAAVRRGGGFGIFEHTAAGWRTIKSGAASARDASSPQGPLVRSGPATHTPETYNQIEVVTLGDYARVIINGRMAMDVANPRLPGESEVGVYAEADADKDYPWLIESVSIISLCHGTLKGYC